ncbi:hypothetical protein K443DRAFT_9205 [Laccaria amethystina LaAM-08-1]|uniref:DUF6699 domain-containing protein n=1 Tax=Laccaria amethystina LaAM-08-1 TaxID=1095629 RepID=A0A0C9XQW4_9AGAR|nr:hypothetical protein K443DRAFT_9205 [Laccaria amethystina LaAM-08-1]
MHSPEELNQLATHLPITRLRIKCDLIPRWPIDQIYNAPITVYDIMMATSDTDTWSDDDTIPAAESLSRPLTHADSHRIVQISPNADSKFLRQMRVHPLRITRHESRPHPDTDPHPTNEGTIRHLHNEGYGLIVMELAP